MNIRHGDMALIGVEKLPEGLTASRSNILLTGSGNNPHTVDRGTFYPDQNGQVVGYLVADDKCRLFHPDHGQEVTKSDSREVTVPKGIYAVRRQIEDTHEGMRAVED